MWEDTFISYYKGSVPLYNKDSDWPSCSTTVPNLHTGTLCLVRDVSLDILNKTQSQSIDAIDFVWIHSES